MEIDEREYLDIDAADESVRIATELLRRLIPLATQAAQTQDEIDIVVSAKKWVEIYSMFNS